jgi:PAS domain S-box-containing protein
MIRDQHASLLIVDDEVLHMKALCDTLEQEGYSTTGFTSAKEALQALRNREFDLLLTDLMMPEMDGISLIQAALAIDRNLAGIVMTGQGTIPTAVEAMKIGAVDYVLKPFKVSVVLPVISRALNTRRLRLENIQLQETVAIYELSMTIAFARDSDTILRKMVDAIFQEGDAASVSVLLPADDGKELYVAVAAGKNAEHLQGNRVPIPEQLANVQSTPLRGSNDIGSDISIPMLAAGKLMGVLNFSSDRPHRPVPLGRIKSLNILAGTAASALHVASLLDELRAAEQRYRRLADNAPDIIFRYDLLPQRRCVYMSPAVTAVTGYKPEDFYADPDLVLKITVPEDRPMLQALSHDRLQGNTATLRWLSADGKTVWIEQRTVLLRDKDLKLIAIEGIARDITERVNLEQQLRQSQRMEAVGRLAAGVAHDFNNILTVIGGYSELALESMAAGNPHRGQIEQIRKAGDRAAGLTRQLLAFGRKQILQPRVLNMNVVVGSYSKMLGRVLGEDIELVTVMEPNVANVKADEGQLEQVLMNLSVNARDAMPDGGKLTIETRNVILDESYSQGHIEVAPGSYVVLEVSDTGCGMDSTTQSQIFEPFFTTKEAGRGTGLGLSIVYGIIKQSGGSIWVYSEVGKGTTFKIYLPRNNEQVEQRDAAVNHTPVSKGSEAVLVAEDDPVVRKLTCTILQSAGYKVFEAENGRDALEAFQRHKGQIAIIISDLVMPEFGGLALIEKIKEIEPAIRVLYTSGYSDEVIVRHGYVGTGIPFIQKPFGASDLLRKIREILDLSQEN